MTGLRASVIALSVMLTLPACIDADFARPSKVQTPRVLAIVVDPPVVGVDTAANFIAMAVNVDGTPMEHDPAAGVVFDWHACLVSESVPGLGGMQYDADGTQQGCGGARSIPMTVNDTGVATLPAGLLSQVLAGVSLESVGHVLGLPATLLLEALNRTGVILTVELRVVRDESDSLVAFKRVVLIDRPQSEVVGDNPPPPRFAIRELGADISEARWLSARGEVDRFECQWEGLPLRLQTNRSYVLDPIDVPDAEHNEADWRESYEVIDLTGRFATLREQPYYAWYATAGRLDQEQTTEPADEEIWRTPAAPGRYPMWVVVRDGHAGMSACRAEVEVE